MLAGLEDVRLHLFVLPKTILWNFALDALHFPVQIAGFILTVNCLSLEFFSSQSDSPGGLLARARELGGMAWVRQHRLPFVVLASAANRFRDFAGTMRSRLCLSPQTPLILCPGKISPAHVQQALLALVESIELKID
jgi:hypothetical protein